MPGMEQAETEMLIMAAQILSGGAENAAGDSADKNHANHSRGKF